MDIDRQFQSHNKMNGKQSQCARCQTLTAFPKSIKALLEVPEALNATKIELEEQTQSRLMDLKTETLISKQSR